MFAPQMGIELATFCGDRPDAPNFLILFTDGKATDKGGKNVQVEEAQKLKDDGVSN